MVNPTLPRVKLEFCSKLRSVPWVQTCAGSYTFSATVNILEQVPELRG
jgi:hypothetical protein